jgi:hypothetical protein
MTTTVHSCESTQERARSEYKAQCECGQWYILKDTVIKAVPAFVADKIETSKPTKTDPFMAVERTASGLVKPLVNPLSGGNEPARDPSISYVARDVASFTTNVTINRHDVMKLHSYGSTFESVLADLAHAITRHFGVPSKITHMAYYVHSSGKTYMAFRCKHGVYFTHSADRLVNLDNFLLNPLWKHDAKRFKDSDTTMNTVRSIRINHGYKQMFEVRFT